MKTEHFAMECKTCKVALAICPAEKMRETLTLDNLTEDEKESVIEFSKKHHGHDVEPVLMEVEPLAQG